MTTLKPLLSLLAFASLLSAPTLAAESQDDSRLLKLNNLTLPGTRSARLYVYQGRKLRTLANLEPEDSVFVSGDPYANPTDPWMVNGLIGGVSLNTVVLPDKNGTVDLIEIAKDNYQLVVRFEKSSHFACVMNKTRQPIDATITSKGNPISIRVPAGENHCEPLESKEAAVSVETTGSSAIQLPRGAWLEISEDAQGKLSSRVAQDQLDNGGSTHEL